MSDGLDLVLQSDHGSVRRAMDDVVSHLGAHGVPAERAEDVRLALTELLNNIVEHAYQGRAGGEIHLELRTRDAQLTLHVVDHGAPVPSDLLERGVMPAFDLDDPLSLPEGGMGLALALQLLDKVHWVHRDGSNHLQVQTRLG